MMPYLILSNIYSNNNNIETFFYSMKFVSF